MSTTGPFDPRAYRLTIGQFPTGVSIVATEAAGEVHGMTANALTSLSLDPMLLLFCVAKRSKMASFLQKADGFSVNILRDEQQALSTYFAGGWKQERLPPFRFVPWVGGPRLEGCAAALGCRMHGTLEGGDHWIVVGEIVALHMGVEPRHPLIFHAGMYRKLDRREIEQAPPDLDEGQADVQVFHDPWDEA